ERTRALIADVTRAAHLAVGAFAVHAAAERRAAIAPIDLGVDALPAAVDEPRRANLRARAVVADEARAARVSGASSVHAAALGGAAMVRAGVRVDAGAVAVDEVARARERAFTAIADMPGLAHLSGAALAIHAAALRGAAVGAIGVGVHAGAAALDEPRLAGADARSTAAELAGRARRPRAALPILTAARGRAAVQPIAVRIDARVAALHEPIRTRERASAAVAHRARRAVRARIPAAQRRAAVVVVAQRVDAQAVALDQPALTRNRAGPGAAHLARPAVLPGAPGLHPAPERGPAVGLILARVDAGAPTRELPRG